MNTAENHDRDWDTTFETGGGQLDVGAAVGMILWQEMAGGGRERGEAAEHQQGAKMCTEPE